MSRHLCRRRFGRRALALGALLTLCLLAPADASAAPRFVAPSGSDGFPGTINQPWKTLAWSFAQLAPGDTLYVRAGRYLERDLLFPVSGTALAPIVVRSYPGENVVIDPTETTFRTPGNDAWTVIDEATGEYMTTGPVGYGVVRAFVDGIPGYENGRVALVPYQTIDDLRATLEAPVNSDAFYVGPGTFEANNRPNLRLAKSAEMRAMESRYGTVFYEENANPADYSIILSAASYTLNVGGSYLVFKDLELDPAYTTIYLQNDVHDVRFDGVTVWVGRDGFRSGQNVHNITITQSRIFGDNPSWVFLSDQDSDFPSAPADAHRTTSISIELGAHDWEISYNHIRGSAQYLIEIPQRIAVGVPVATNISIHHNRMENSADDAMKFDGTSGLGRIEVYENFISNCFRAVSAGQFTPDFQGPLLIYRNVISLLRDPPVNRIEGMYPWNGGGRHGYEYMFKLAGEGFTTKNTHVYHNTLVLLNSAGKGINFMPEDATNGRYANNLLVTVNGRVNNPYRAGIGRVVDGNLYWKMNDVDTERLTESYDTVSDVFAATGLEPNGIGTTPKRGTDPEFMGLDLDVVNPSDTSWAVTVESERHQPWDFTLAATSPARGAAIVMPPHPILGVLPDTRASQDIGALPFGTTAGDFDFFPFDPTPNSAPVVDAGPDLALAYSGDLALTGSVEDDGNPALGGLVTRWSVVSGPGRVEFDDPTSPTTSATFTEVGLYTLVLVASDGDKTSLDEMTVNVFAATSFAQSAVSDSTDDAEEKTAVNINLTSVDLDLGTSEATAQIVGVRFPNLSIPQGAVIANAYIEFTTDDSSAGPCALELRTEMSDDALPFTNGLANLSLRATSPSSVMWEPPDWPQRHEVFQTPNLASILQAVVDRPGWSSGNALVVLIEGTGRREAFSYDGDPASAPRLFVEYVPLAALVGVPTQEHAALRAWVFPNPVSSVGTLHFTTPRAGAVDAELFDVRGRRIRQLLDTGHLAPGSHQIHIGERLSPGMYFYRIRAAGDVATGRFLIIK